MLKKILLVLYITAESVEEDRDKLDLADSAYLSQETPGFGYPSLFTGEMNRDGKTFTPHMHSSYIVGNKSSYGTVTMEIMSKENNVVLLGVKTWDFLFS